MKKNSPETHKHYLAFERTFSDENVHPYDEISWTYLTAEITDEKGKAIFKQEHIEVPEAFSDLATKILASKYFYGDMDHGTGPHNGRREPSFKEVIDRVAGTVTEWGLASTETAPP